MGYKAGSKKLRRSASRNGPHRAISTSSHIGNNGE